MAKCTSPLLLSLPPPAPDPVAPAREAVGWGGAGGGGGVAGYESPWRRQRRMGLRALCCFCCCCMFSLFFFLLDAALSCIALRFLLCCGEGGVLCRASGFILFLLLGHLPFSSPLLGQLLPARPLPPLFAPGLSGVTPRGRGQRPPTARRRAAAALRASPPPPIRWHAGTASKQRACVCGEAGSHSPGEVISDNHKGQCLASLSRNYDPALFAEQPPADPSTTAEVLLAVIVIIPELVAIVVHLIGPRHWRQRDLWVLAFIFGAGLVSLVVIIALAAREAGGRRVASRGGAVRAQWRPSAG